jgi:hypothetical protein
LPSETRFLRKDKNKNTLREDEEENISSYWINIRKKEDTGRLKRKH